MCVFTSLEHAFIWSGINEFRGFRDWCAKHYPGGGYPEKVDKLVAAYCRHHKLPIVEEDGVRCIVRPSGEKFSYLQYEGPSLKLAEEALGNGLLVCTTLYRSPRYGPGIIYHMVNLAHLGSRNAAILDNNFQPYEWDSRARLEPRLKLAGRVWLIVVNRHGPPPPPK
ncbi:MAG: hypothetical protein KatS3mg105_3318 [Gemmatales bacterium]|nr:MAG: hypothetical protein KatS3mg105_3318 [Gemmatales bacterium]